MVDGGSGHGLVGIEPLGEREVLAALGGCLLRLNDGMSVLRKMGQQPMLFVEILTLLLHRRQFPVVEEVFLVRPQRVLLHLVKKRLERRMLP